MNLQDTSAPVGTIIAFVGKIATSQGGSSQNQFTTQIEAMGWMLCDGSSLSAAAYPELYAVLGDLYGFSQENMTFNLPDLKGQFLGGLNNNGASTNYLIKYSYRLPVFR